MFLRNPISNHVTKFKHTPLLKEIHVEVNLKSNSTYNFYPYRETNYLTHKKLAVECHISRAVRGNIKHIVAIIVETVVNGNKVEYSIFNYYREIEERKIVITTTGCDIQGVMKILYL